jgi:hypothetical protein
MTGVEKGHAGRGFGWLREYLFLSFVLSCDDDDESRSLSDTGASDVACHARFWRRSVWFRCVFFRVSLFQHGACKMDG